MFGLETFFDQCFNNHILPIENCKSLHIEDMKKNLESGENKSVLDYSDYNGIVYFNIYDTEFAVEENKLFLRYRWIGLDNNEEANSAIGTQLVSLLDDQEIKWSWDGNPIHTILITIPRVTEFDRYIVDKRKGKL